MAVLALLFVQNHCEQSLRGYDRGHDEADDHQEMAAVMMVVVTTSTMMNKGGGGDDGELRLLLESGRHTAIASSVPASPLRP